MYIVVDWHHTRYYGPFQTEEEGQEWLAKQNINIGQYKDQEVSVTKLLPLTDTLEGI